jgi:hypothetical protein
MKKSAWIWKIKDIEGGDPLKIAAKAKLAGFSDVYIKVADGGYRYNITNGVDKCPATVAALKAVGIKVWGWHYVYGYPQYEIAAARVRIDGLKLDGYIIDAEYEYKDKPNEAQSLTNILRSSYPNLPIAIASYRFPTLHPEFPWKQFLGGCSINMPQVYWQGAHNAGDQLERSFNEFKALNAKLGVNPAYEPVASVYSEHGWTVESADVKDFLDRAEKLNLPAVSFYCWDDAITQGLSDQWKVVEDYGAPVVVVPPPVVIPPVDERIKQASDVLTAVISDIGKLNSLVLQALSILKK